MDENDLKIQSQTVVSRVDILFLTPGIQFYKMLFLIFIEQLFSIKR